MGLVIKLFGDPEVTLDGEVIDLSVALPTLALFILWRDRSDVEADDLVDVLRPRSEAEERTSFLKKHKTKLRDLLHLELPKTLKPTILGPAILDQAWVDVVCFDEKIGSGDSQEMQEALELRLRGPLLAGRKDVDIFAEERRTREEKYQTALWKLIEEKSECQHQEAVRFITLLLECAEVPESRAVFLREENLRLEHEIFKGKLERGDGKTTRTMPTRTLPNFPTELIGREAEIEAVQELLFAPGMVTLMGPAGIGKTRIAVAVAHRLQENFPAGAGFVDLTTASDAEQGIGQISAVLGLAEEKDRSRRETLLASLEDKNLLLVWDNCEHLAAECAELAAEVLRRCPGVRLLTTSRESLRVYGERLYPVAVLPKESAIRLFLIRAQAVQPDFQITEQNRAAVLRICRDLDGLPLALELAAALLSIRAVAWIADNLDRRFEVLVDGPRGGSSRHASLQVAFDLSYDLLPPAEQALLRAFGVFAGTFDLDAAEAVAAVPNTAHLLTQLVRKSLVMAEEQDQEMRFRLLASLRQYALDKLRKQGEGEVACRRHRDYFLALAEEADPQLRGPKQKLWLDRLETEHDNFRAALAWRMDEAGTRLACALQRFWWVRGHLEEGRKWLAHAIKAGESGSTDLRAKVLTGLGNLAQAQGSFLEARTLYQESMTLQTAAGNDPGIAVALYGLATMSKNLGDYAEAEEIYQQSLSRFREIGDNFGMADALTGLGLLAQNQQKYEAGENYHRESLALWREAGNPVGIAASLICLGNIAHEQGRYESARALLEESLALNLQIGNTIATAKAYTHLGRVFMAEEDYEAARNLFHQGLTLMQSVNNQWGIVETMNYLGSAAYLQNDYKEAKYWIEQTYLQSQRIGNTRASVMFLSNLASITLARENYQEAKDLFRKCLVEFRPLQEKQAIANTLVQVACIEEALGTSTKAAVLFGAAEALLELIGYQRPPSEARRYEEGISETRAALSEDQFESAWAEGRAMTWEQAVAFALGEDAS